MTDVRNTEMKIIPTWPPRDPLRFLIHGFFGMLIGAVMGLGAYIYSPFLESSDTRIPLFLHMGAGAILIGLVAGLYGDEFWEDICKYWW
jgi:hypothetical protein